MPNDVAALVARIRARVNVTSTTVLPDVEIIEALNSTQERLVQSGSEWLSQEQSLAFTYGTATDGFPLPANYVKLAAVSQRDTSQTDPSLALTAISPTERRQWIDRANAVDVSRDFPVPALTAFYYYLWDEKLFIVPQPAANITVVLDFYGPPAELSLSAPDTTNQFTRMYFRTLKWGALADIWDFLGQEDMSLAAEARFAQYAERARAVETATRTGGAKRVRGV